MKIKLCFEIVDIIMSYYKDSYKLSKKYYIIYEKLFNYYLIIISSNLICNLIRKIKNQGNLDLH